MKISNENNISLPLAVWLVHDTYDYIKGVKNYISVTTLMKPLRQVILSQRIPFEEQTADVSDYIARKLGNAIHDSIEKAWVDGYAQSLTLLGHPQKVIDQIMINPTDEELEEAKKTIDPIPVYLEQRSMREIDGWTIGGKYDLVCDGIVQDNKSTSVWGWVKGTRLDEHTLQMSLYRWLDAAKEKPRITAPYGKINYIFTDWSKTMLRTPNYPELRVMDKTIPLMELEDTETWVKNRLALFEVYKNTPEADLPYCTDEELWRSDPQYKYYSDPTKTDGRSTKNFDNLADAHRFMAEKGNKGIVITKPGEPKACGYCPAYDVCTQKDEYFS